MRLSWLRFLVAVALIGSFTPTRANAAEQIPPELAGLPERWRAAMEEFRVPGLAVVVVKDDRVIYRGCFGLRDVEKRLPVTPDTAFYIASATKPFTAMGLVKLAEEGKVDLDAPVRRYLPKLELPDAALAEKLTVRDLLCHRYGIRCGAVVLLDAYTGEITDDRYFRLLKARGEVAGGVEYTNIHFTLAGRVIEAASGKPWRDYLAEVIFTPAGMTTATGYADEMYARADVALPYQLAASGFVAAPRKVDATMHAAGGLGLSIDDLARWLRLNINAGEIDGKRIISAESAREMLRLQSERKDGQIRRIEGFGLGWLLGTYRGQTRYVIHTGGYLGAAAHVSFMPDKRIGVAVVTNGDASAGIFAEQVVSIDVLDRFADGNGDDLLADLRTMLPERLPRIIAQRTVTEADITAEGALSQPPERYTGVFVNPDFGTLKVERVGSNLRITLGVMPIRLTRCSGDRFTARDVDENFDGRFVVENERVAAVVLPLHGQEVRFERR